jgi:MltA-interacting protein MipA
MQRRRPAPLAQAAGPVPRTAPACGRRSRPGRRLPCLLTGLVLVTSAVATAWAAPSPRLLLTDAGRADEAVQATITPGTAATGASHKPDADTGAHRWRYSVGLKWRVNDVGYPSRAGSLRPMLGLRYGRWRLGANTGEDWLRYDSYLKESNLEYDWLERDRLRVGLSARIQNLDDNASFDGFAGGRNTLRGRAHISWRLTQRWSIGSEITQDLLVRGDGTTLTAGLSYLWPLSERSSVGLGAGATWATGTHLQTRHRSLPRPADGWQAGLSEWGAGVSWRYSIDRRWALFASVGSATPLGPLRDVSPSVTIWNGQMGLLYFSH